MKEGERIGLKMRKQCKHKGCHKLAELKHNFCSVHIADEEKYKKRYIRYDKKYDRESRWVEGSKFYKSHNWQKFRETILARDNYLCQKCLSKGIIKNANTVHHIIEIRNPEGWDRRLDSSNCITICPKCHSEIHKKKEIKKGGYVRGHVEGIKK